jgi:hypothetical protein
MTQSSNAFMGCERKGMGELMGGESEEGKVRVAMGRRSVTWIT